MELKENKGQAGLAPIFTLVAFSILLIVGVMIFSTFDTQASNLVTNTAATASVSNLTSSFYSGTNIMSIGPVVLAAVIILAIVALLSRAR